MSEESRNEPLVSVIIPCYCQENYLPRVFASLNNQTHKNIEVIVIDDGSPSPVRLPAGEWAFNVTLVRQDNTGLSGARNAGLEWANGEYIKFLDADDELLPDCIEIQTRSIAGAERALSVIGYIETNEDTGAKRNIIPAFGDPCQALLHVNIGPPHCYLYSSALINDTGQFYIGERTDGGHEDYDFVMRASSYMDYAVTVHKPGVIYYKRQGTMSSNNDSMDRTRAAVWSHNVVPLLNAASAEERGERVLAAISGWIELSRVTGDTNRHYLDKACDMLIEWAGSRAKNIELSDSEVSLMIERLSGMRFSSAIKLTKTLQSFPTKPVPIGMTAQEVIDRRFSASDVMVSTDWYLTAFTMLSMYKGKYAIYGAGALGEKLGRYLTIYGHPPECFIDQNAKEGQLLHDIPVVKVTDARLADVSAVFIASKAYSKEMRSTVKSCLPGVSILESSANQ